MIRNKKGHEFRPVPGYEGHYLVSEYGQVWSVRRLRKSKEGRLAWTGGKFLKQHITDDGYWRTTLCKDAKLKPVSTHILVARAFVPHPDESKDEVNHMDGVKTNNHYSNLEWVNDLEQAAHAKAMGLLNPPRGETHPFAKLTDRQVVRIRALYATQKFSQYELAGMFGVQQPRISTLVNLKARA